MLVGDLQARRALCRARRRREVCDNCVKIASKLCEMALKLSKVAWKFCVFIASLCWVGAKWIGPRLILAIVIIFIASWGLRQALVKESMDAARANQWFLIAWASGVLTFVVVGALVELADDD